MGADVREHLTDTGEEEDVELLLRQPVALALVADIAFAGEEFLQVATTPDGGDIVVDFFAGTGSTLDAVFQQNAEDKGNRRARNVAGTRRPAAASALPKFAL